ncbi:MAG: glycosyltransferase family 4 protein, partial [Proteobacteria bacterium]|nr:glycosyltransferase family 4 protein [Pseudomonadota bacterium]
RRLIQPKVICRRQSDIQDKYLALGIDMVVEPELPLFSPTEAGWKPNLSLLKHSLPRLLRQYKNLDHLADEINESFDLVHFNHASLFVLAARLRRLTDKPFTTHIRTRPENTILTRSQARSILRSSDALIYITENERDYFEKLAGKAPGEVIFNPSILPPNDLSPHPDVPHDGRLKIASLKSFRLTLGHTRLVEMASALADRGGRNKLLFVMAGDMRLHSSLPGRLGQIGAQGGDFEDFVGELGLGDFFLFLGWVPEPERVLAACDLLAAPSTENNPWGRDIIEAYSLGKPVIATGKWDVFVKNGQTGLLADGFEADKFARDLLRLCDDRESLRRMGEAGRRNISSLCNPIDRARDLQAHWQSVAHH